VADAETFDEIKSALASDDDRETKSARIAKTIRGSRDYRWVGIYEIDGEAIAAIAWTGQDVPAFPRFPKTKGLCGAAILAGKTIAVGDVTKDPRYLTTFGSTRSEIVAPIFELASKTVIGLVDIESEQLNNFQDADRIFLESCATALAGLWE